MLIIFMQKPIIFSLVLLNLISTINLINGSVSLKSQSDDVKSIRLWLTVSAEKGSLEISWYGAPAKDNDFIILATKDPIDMDNVKLQATLLERTQSLLNEKIVNTDDNTDDNNDNNDDANDDKENNNDKDFNHTDSTIRSHWISNEDLNGIIMVIKPISTSLWFTTTILFDHKLLNNITIDTSCYGYWANYVSNFSLIQSTTCLRVYPTWMRDLRSSIGTSRIRDLFIPGTHDSGSYRTKRHVKDTIITKYTLTQDDDIFSQLMHGIRYLDIRVGYYRNSEASFYINHGITRLIPLIDVINQVKDFVEDTNEIVIFGLKEFPVGFGLNLSIHHRLVNFLADKFGDLIVHPSVTWKASLNEIWSRKQNIILAYDKSIVVNMYPHTLFTSVEQRWGNVRKWSDLEHYLKTINTFDILRISDRPVADMAELTPDTWDIILNRYGGLSRMADGINWRVSALYRDHLINKANIVAVDFYRGTTLIDLAINWNNKTFTLTKPKMTVT